MAHVITAGCPPSLAASSPCTPKMTLNWQPFYGSGRLFCCHTAMPSATQSGIGFGCKLQLCGSGSCLYKGRPEIARTHHGWMSFFLFELHLGILIKIMVIIYLAHQSPVILTSVPVSLSPSCRWMIKAEREPQV